MKSHQPPYRSGEIVVSGKVCGSGGGLIAGSQVRVSSRGLKGKTELGSTNSDSDGYFEIGVVESTGKDRGLKRFHLVVEVLDQDVQPIYESPVYFNVESSFSVQITLPDCEEEALGRILDDVDSELQGADPAKLAEEDFAFIGRSRELEPGKVRNAIHSKRMAMITGLPATSIYSILEGGPSTRQANAANAPAGATSSFGDDRVRLHYVVLLGRLVHFDAGILKSLFAIHASNASASPLEIAVWRRAQWVELLDSAWGEGDFPSWAQEGDRKTKLTKAATYLMDRVATAFPKKFIEHHLVHGSVATGQGRPGAGLVVEVLHKGLQGETAIGSQCSTDWEGQYRAFVDPAVLRHVVGSAANLQLVVRVMQRDGTELARSGIRFGARLPEEVNLTVDQKVGPTQFELIGERLREVGLTDGLADVGAESIKWMAGASGVSREGVERFLQARRVAGETERLTSDVLFVLLEKPPASPRAKPERNAEQLLRKAIEAHVVRDCVLDQVEAATLWIQGQEIEERVVRLRRETSEGTPPNAVQILREAGLREGELERYIQVLAEDPNMDPKSACQRLAGCGISEGGQNIIHRSQRISELVGQESRTIGRLVRELSAEGDSQSQRDMVLEGKDAGLRALATRDAKAWDAWLQPEDFGSAADRWQRALQLEESLEAAFPAEALRARLVARTSSRRAGGVDYQTLLGFLKRESQLDLRGKGLEFQLRDTGSKGPTNGPDADAGSERKSALLESIRMFVGSEEHHAGPEETEVRVAQLESELNSLQRLSRVAAFDDALDLLESGYTSARGIAAVDRDSFVEEIAGVEGEREREEEQVRREKRKASAASIHDLAKKRAAHAIAIATGLQGAYAGIKPGALKGGKGDKPGKDDSGGSNSGGSVGGRPPAEDRTGGTKANLESLFGAPDACAVRDCESVLGEAAYLVDLLELLSSFIMSEYGKPSEVLLERRPDLARIELSCENSETPMPYVDLVIELLEMEVEPVWEAVEAREPRPNGHVPLLDVHALKKKKQRRARAWYQTTWDADALALYPEHLNKTVYTKLAQATYPWSLPFLLANEEAETYLREIKLDRAQLMRRLLHKPASGWAQEQAAKITRSEWGIGMVAYKILIGNVGSKQWESWGFDRKPSRWPEVMGKSLQKFLSRAGLSYVDGLELLESHFVNPVAGGVRQVSVAQDPSADACDLRSMRLEGVDDGFLNRVQRFVRLSRICGWTTREVDQAVAHLGSGDINSICLDRMLEVRRIVGRLNLSPIDVLVFWGDLDTQSSFDRKRQPPTVLPSQYSQRFQNKKKLSESALGALSLENDALPKLEEVYVSALGALEMSLDDYELLTSDGSDSQRERWKLGAAEFGTTTSLLPGLSALSRWATLSNATGHTILDLARFQALSGIEAFSSPASTLCFLGALAEARSLKAPIDDLDFFLRHVVTEERLRRFEEEARQVLLGIRQDANRNAGGAELTWASVAPLIAAELARINQLPGQLVTGLLAWAESQSGEGVSDSESLLHLLEPIPESPEDETLLDLNLANAADSLADRNALVSHDGWPIWVRLTKMVWAARQLGIDFHDLDSARSVNYALPFLAQTEIPVTPLSSPPSGAYEGWGELALFAALKSRLSKHGKSFWPLHSAATKSEQQGSSVASTWAAVADAFGCTTGEIDELVGSSLLGFAEPAAGASVGTWLRFLSALDLVKDLGVSMDQLQAWTGDNLSLSVSADVRGSVSVRYGEESWQNRGHKLRGDIRGKQRDALAAFVMHERKMDTTDQLSNHLLVDLEMGSAQMTSRLRLATASVQRFVQRCLLGAERTRNGKQVSLPDQFEQQWKWFKSYRSWRDNRSLFLFPENFLRPELRDNKSPFFAEVEQLLSQRELNEDALEETFGVFLGRLDDTSRLEVLGTCLDERTMHIIGRTRDVPHEHFQRTWSLDTEEFSPWERLDLDIDGDWVLPIVLKGRLSLYWLKHKRQLEGMQDTLGMIPSSPFPLSPHLPMYQDQYSLSWSTKRRKGWTKKRSADRHIARPIAPFLPVQFAVRVDGDRLKIGGVSSLPALPSSVGGDLTGFLSMLTPPDWLQEGKDAAEEAALRAAADAKEAAEEAAKKAADEAYKLLGETESAINSGLESGALPDFPDMLAELSKIAGGVDSVAKSITGDGDGWSIKSAFDAIWSNMPDIPEEGGANPSVVFPPGIEALLESLQGALGWAKEALGGIADNNGSAIQWMLKSVTEQLSSLVSEIFDKVQSGALHIESLLTGALAGISQILDETLLLLGGPTLGFEFGYFDVSESRGKALRLAPPPSGPSPVSVFLILANMATAIPAILVESAKALAYTLFPGYPAFFDVPTLTDVPYANLALGGVGTNNLGARAWPGSGFLFLPSGGDLQSAGFCTLALNFAQIHKEEMEGMEIGGLASDNSDAAGGLPGLVGFVDAASQSMANLESQARDLSTIFSVRMRMVRPAPLDPYPGRIFNPSPTIIGEDRWARTYLLVPRVGHGAKKEKGKTPYQSSVKWSPVVLYHPVSTELNRVYERDGIHAIFESASRPSGAAWKAEKSDAFSESFTSSHTGGELELDSEHAVERLDFSVRGSCSIYNWELLYHLPMLIGGKYRASQNFDQALRWYRKVFDPTIAHGDAPERFWRFKPFFEEFEAGDHLRTIAQWMRDLSSGNGNLEERATVEAWRQDPFNAHLVARLRPGAYERSALMRTVEVLVDWGDLKFREETWESINEATQLYLLAREVLGPKPSLVPAKPSAALTYEQLESQAERLAGGVDAFGNALLQVEAALANSEVEAEESRASHPGLAVLSGPSFLYFAIPPNQLLLDYWDTVEDRLHKIRQSLDIQGQARSPYPEGLGGEAWTDAMANLSANMSGTVEPHAFVPLPSYRFQFVLQKAFEFVRGMNAHGAQLLGSLEKRDAEGLARLRSGHELSLLRATSQVRELQLGEARDALAALQQGSESARLRHEYYSSREFLNSAEQVKEVLSMLSSGLQIASGAQELGAAVLSALPNVTFGAAGAGGSPGVSVSYGSTQLAGAVSAVARAFSFMASSAQIGSSMAGTMAMYQRRQEDWEFQAELAANEMEQVELQIKGAEKRVAIADRELQSHQKQVGQSEEMAGFMHEKFTNQELYEWMVGQASAAHYQSYLLAVDMAKRAEASYRFERAGTAAKYVQVENWDGLAMGLMAGERLEQDLRRMESAFLDSDERGHELTKHISLAQVDPVAFLTLQRTGSCYVEFPEGLFDADHPGQYLRRIKSVGISIPCVVGPYTGVHCRLSLAKSAVRITGDLGPGQSYERLVDDPRFSSELGPRVTTMVTSSGQNDSGLFEANLRDERYLPFEGAGAISTWRIDLPRETNRFDFSSIVDVVMHVRFTARDSEALREPAWNAMFGAGVPAAPLTRMFHGRTEWPDAWARFLRPHESASGPSLELELSELRFPFHQGGQSLAIKAVRFVFIPTEGSSATEAKVRFYEANVGGGNQEPVPGAAVAIADSELAGLATASIVADAGIPTGSYILSLEANDHTGNLPSVLERLPSGAIRIKEGGLFDVVVICTYERN